MKTYTVGKKPVFSASVPIVEESDPVNATVTNAPAKQLIENDLALKEMLESKAEPDEGMGFSHNDFTDEYKEAVDGLGGLKFGQDAEGNWGYTAPGTEEIIPFGNDNGDGYASKELYGDYEVNVGRAKDTGYKAGAFSAAFGKNVVANGDHSFAEGHASSAYGENSHAEGMQTTANGMNAHAEGLKSIAAKANAHAEGNEAVANEENAHAEGEITTANGRNAHAEGYSTIASGVGSHAEGMQTEAQGGYSHAEGACTNATGINSHAGGYRTYAANFASTAIGKCNANMVEDGTADNTSGHAFVIGNGTDETRKRNALSVMYDGSVKAASTVTGSTTADYAEFFEWGDGNPGFEDRVGYFVTMDGDKIKIAGSGDSYILGIVSGEPFVLGNGDCDVWNGMVLRDEFGRVIYERAPWVERAEFQREDGTKTVGLRPVLDADGKQLYKGTRPKLNPDYNPAEPYVSRFDRPEWSPVGMLGVLSVRQDGTCKVNGYCTCGEGGIATACEEGDKNSYRVIKVISGQVVKVVFR